MPDSHVLEAFLDSAQIDAAVFALRPDYRALLVAVDGIVPGPSDQTSDALVQAAENAAGEALSDQLADQLPQVAAWREAYRAFGASRNAPATVWRRCCAAPRRLGYRE